MQAWEEFLSKQSDLGKENIERWLKTLKIVKYDACNLYLEAKDSFQTLWFEEHIRHRLKNLVNNNGRQIHVHLVAPSISSFIKNPSLNEPASFIIPDTMHPHFTLSFLTETEENTLVYQLITQLISKEVTLGSFNPVFIYGSKGTGKTHFLTAAAHEFISQKLNVFFVNAETFTEHVVKAIRQGKMQEFRKSYRNIDILMIDDIHIFSRKAATQEEFFHTFNTLHTLGKQIFITSNMAPKDLVEIEQRLISRFEWGLTLTLLNNKNHLLPILLMKAKAFKISLIQDIQHFLLNHFGTNPKTLCSALEALVFRANLQSQARPLTLKMTEELLVDLIEDDKKNATTPQTIVKAVSNHFSLRVNDLLGKGQNREVSLPRQIAMYFCRMHLKMPFVKIGEFFGRDHSTVMTNIRYIEKAIQEKSQDICLAYLSIAKRLEIEES